MKFKFLFAFLMAFQTVFSQNNLIPKPQKVELGSGFFVVPKTVTLNSSDSKQVLSEIKFFNNSKTVFANTKSKNSHIIFGLLPPSLKAKNENSYKIEILKNKIIISSATDTGRFYALNTLMNLFDEYKDAKKIPALTIEDSPKFKWRGMHLDVSRHFFTKDEVKKYIDYLAMYKFNTFHWHLTDDQGWRIEIKKYPKLTEVGGWRNGSMIGHYREQRFDDKRYGGFYTQEEVKEVVKYAAERHITVVPEIEMPGHAVAAISAYPWLSCTGKQIPVEKMWGVFDDIFCPKDETFNFLENVLTEVMALFPSKIIHIGGDEAPKTRWKECAHCQALIKKEGLKNEHELQSYFIQRIEKFLNSKGRKIIGWDEILEGGLAPNAAVMSWQGIKGGIEAAKMKHDVVMTPTSPLYFDYYQGDPKSEPLAFGGYNTLEKIYQFNPIPTELTPDEQKYVLGAQGNMWTEYINDFNHVEYMLFPRAMALSEVVWGTANPEKYNEFLKRVFANLNTLNKKGINYSTALFNVTAATLNSNNEKDAILLSLNGFNGAQGIRYTTDGSNPTNNSTKYETPLPINQNTTVKAAYFEDGVMKSKVMEQKVYVSKSTGKKISLKIQPDSRHYRKGAETLVDGFKGDPTNFGQDWAGFLSDVVATIEFPQETEISNLKMNFINGQTSWIHLPKLVRITIAETGKTYELSKEEIIAKNGIMNLDFPKTKTKKVIVEALNVGKIPEGKEGAGNIAWLFVDEISLD